MSVGLLHGKFDWWKDIPAPFLATKAKSKHFAQGSKICNVCNRDYYLIWNKWWDVVVKGLRNKVLKLSKQDI